MEVTIGLPVYNAEKYIKDCIVSILNQSYSSFKLLIVDDGSTDNSIEIIKSFNDSRIELLIDGENKGLPARLNQIANLCDSEYLVRMDSDDIMHVQRIEIQLNIMKKNPVIDVLGTNCYIINDKNNITGIRNVQQDSLSIRGVNRFDHPTIFAKTKWFLDNPYNEAIKRAQDTELWNRTKNNSEFMETSLPLLFYREFGSSYYKKYWQNLKSKKIVLKKYFKLSTITEFLTYLFKDYLKSFIMAVIYSIAAIFKLENILVGTRSYTLSRRQLEAAIRDLENALK